MDIKKFLTNLVFPKFCLGCKKEGAYLCEDCLSLLDILEYNYCLCEKNPIRLQHSSQSGKCSKCYDKKIDGLYFALPYNLAKNLIYQFKYNYLKNLSAELASILIEHFIKTGKNTDEIWHNSALISAPLHIKKLRERGYNQSEELAKELSKILKVPVLTDVLIKTKATKPQMELKKEEREKNLQNTFAINQNRATSEVARFNKIFLVDDVYTTGSTMQECALTLKKAGAKSVWGICLAREEFEN